jgi:hypothetical protein
MGTERDRLYAVLFHGWVDVFLLFMVLLVSFTAWRWAALRRRPSSAGEGRVPWGMVLLCFGLTLMVRGTEQGTLRTVIVSLAVLAAGWLSLNTGRRWVWPLAVMVAALLGAGQMLGALALACAGMLASFARASST